MNRCLKTLCCLSVLIAPGMTGFAAEADEVRIEKGIPYLGEDRQELADLYLPPSVKPGELRPAVVIIHGGGWSGGKRDAAREINIGTTLASHGYVCLSIDYLLQKDTGPRIWPQNLYDCKTAVRWLRANAERLQIDADHIGVIGGSAGGHLAAMVGATGPDAGLDPDGPYGEHSCRVQAVVNMYGAIADIGPRNFKLTGKTPEEDPELSKQVTPLSHLDKDDPPVLILHGTADKTVELRDSAVYAEACARAGVEHEMIVIPNAPHTFHLQPKQRDLRPVVLEFFDRHLKPGKSAGRN